MRHLSKILKNQGFTLVELLVVVAIISLVGSVVFVQIEKARAKSRDAQREKDIKTIQDALALYVVNSKNFPLSDGDTALTGTDSISQELINKEAISKIPKDPFNAGDYRYLYNSANGSTYSLTYYLETETISGKSSGQQSASP